MKIKALVTGADGQLGRTIQGLYSKSELEIDFKFVSKIELDIANADKVNSFFNKNEFDFCINCAAYTNVKQSEMNPELAFKVNSRGVENLALSCKEFNTILIHISTDYVFDGKKNTPYTEDAIPNPINQYGKSKLEGEKLIQSILNKYYIIRTSWLYSEYGNNFVKTILKISLSQKKIEVVGDQIGSPTSAVDLTETIFKIMQSRSNAFGIYHYSNLGQISWYDFACEIFNILKIRKKIISTKKVERDILNRPSYSVMNTLKIQEQFSITILNWRDSLRKILIK